MDSVLISQRYYYLNSVVTRRRAPSLNNFVVKVLGTIEQKRLSDCLSMVVSVHDALRTSFYSVGINICDRISTDSSCELQCLDIGGSTIEKFLEDTFHEFDLRSTPLVRFFYVQSSEANYLVLQLPHINSDGWSLQKLVEHISALYSGRPLPRIGSFQRYKEAYSNYFGSLRFAKDKTYWQLMENELVSELYENQPSRYESHSVTRDFSEEIMQLVIAKCESNGLTLFQLTLFVSMLLISILRGRASNAVMFSVHNRGFESFLPGESFEDTVGLIVNRLFFPIEIDDTEKVGDFFSKCLQQFTMIMRHHKYPFERIVEGFAPKNRKLLTPLYFNFFQYPDSYAVSDEVSFVFEKIYKGQERLPLGIELVGVGSCLRTVIASNGTYAVDQVDHLSHAYEVLLMLVCGEKEMTVGQILRNGKDLLTVGR